MRVHDRQEIIEDGRRWRAGGELGTPSTRCVLYLPCAKHVDMKGHHVGPDGEIPNTYPPQGGQYDVYNDPGAPKGDGKPLPPHPLLASPTGAPPLAPGMARPFGTDQGAYYPPQQARMVVVPTPAHAPPNGQASPPGAPLSALSSGQSSTQVGSDGEPVKTKPYSAVGGYGFSTQTQGQGQPAELGVQHGGERSQASTFGSNYNPYDGIDHTYREGQTSGGEGEAPAYTDPNNSGGQHYNAQKHAA